MQEKRFGTLIGLTAVGAVLTGVGSLLVALLAVSNYDFIAPALSFGLLANAILRN